MATFDGLRHCYITLFLFMCRSVRIIILFSPIFCLPSHWCVFRHSGQKTCTHFNDGECDYYNNYYVYGTLDIIRESSRCALLTAYPWNTFIMHMPLKVKMKRIASRMHPVSDMVITLCERKPRYRM